MRHRSLLVLAGFSIATSATVAQIQYPPPVTYTDRPYTLDSGYLANPAASARVVFRGTVELARDADWIQLHFQNTNLPAGTRLRLTSRLDGAVQWFDAGSLRDYSNESAYFNGNAVDVELVAGANTRGNRVFVFQVRDGGVAIAETICGRTDDRRPSEDPRAGRAAPNGCSMWLAGPRVVLTAGHCASGANQIHVNVPLSTGSGGYVAPPPDDQYPVITATRQLQNSGVGADWMCAYAGRNSNTGLYPGQGQGGWYNVGTLPGSVGGNNIRITGYGTTGSGVPRQWNGAQKTHVGPLASLGSTSLRYRTDTTGGNSGSPVIHENTGNAIGIHTHGGCSSSGGSNQGTRIDRSNLRSALQALLQSPGGFYNAFGNGCAGSAGTATLSSVGFPDVGRSMTIQVDNVPANQMGVLWFGASDATWSGSPLPMPLDSYGMTGCSLLVSLDSPVPLSTGSGNPSYNLRVPTTAALIGHDFFNQYAAVDFGANPAGVVLTNAGKGTVGE